MYYMNVVNGYIVCLSTMRGGIEISAEKYFALSDKVHTKPNPLQGFDYFLRADTLEWELVELPPEQEDEVEIQDKAEAYDILMGGAP